MINQPVRLFNAQGNEHRSKNAIFITEDQIVSLRRSKITYWPEDNKVWSFNLGPKIIATTTAVANFLVCRLYSKKFNIRNSFAMIPPVLVSCMMPAAFSLVAFDKNFTSKLLASTRDNFECPVCLEIRSNALHLIFGSCLPIITSWFGTYFAADTTKSMAVPDFPKDFFKNKKTRSVFYRDFLNVAKKTNKNVTKTLLGNMVLQSIVLSTIIYFQQKQFIDIESKIHFTEDEIKGLIKIEAPEDFNFIKKIKSFFSK